MRREGALRLDGGFGFRFAFLETAVAKVPGSVPIGGFIGPLSSEDVYPVVDMAYGIGGFREVADVTARDAIPAQRRRLGMVVYTIGDNGAWVLGAGLTNADWSPWSPVAIGSREPVVAWIGGNPETPEIVFAEGDVVMN